MRAVNWSSLHDSRGALFLNKGAGTHSCLNEQKASYRTRIDNCVDQIVADVSQDKGGSGEHFRPHELIEAGLAPVSRSRPG